MESINFTKIATNANSLYNKAKQYTEEKFGQAERTELDAHFESLLQRADKTKSWTEKILLCVKSQLQPNPNARMEDYFYDKLDKKKRDRLTASEYLGDTMIDAGNDFGPGTAYGSALVKCGQTQLKMGIAEKDFMETASNNFIQPLQAFLDGDMKTLQKERKILESKRLALDAAKAKLKRLKNSPTPQVEGEIRNAQTEFNRQCEITKLLLEGISSTHAHHLRCLHDFIEAQNTFYAQNQQYMNDLTRQLGSVVLKPTSNVNSDKDINESGTKFEPSELSNIEMKEARVLYDYAAADKTELSVKADELIEVYTLPELEYQWYIVVRGLQKGKVPISYIQII